MSSLKWKMAAVTVAVAGLAFAGGYVGPGFAAVPANIATQGS